MKRMDVEQMLALALEMIKEYVPIINCEKTLASPNLFVVDWLSLSRSATFSVDAENRKTLIAKYGRMESSNNWCIHGSRWMDSLMNVVLGSLLRRPTA
jgi:hypothetical protein